MSGVIILRNEPSLSSVSITAKGVPGTGVSVSPVAANQVGSFPACFRIQATMAEVVVLPWAPATAAIFFPAIVVSSMSMRCIAGIPVWLPPFQVVL